MTAIFPESPDDPDIPPDVPVARPIAREFVSPPPSSAPDLLLLSETRRSAWADIGLLLLFLFAFEFVASAVIFFAAELILGEPISSTQAEDSPFRQTLLLPGIALRATGAIVIIAFLVRRRGLSARSIGLSWSGTLLNMVIGLAALAALYGLILIATPFIWLWPELMKEMEESARRIMALVPKLRPAEFVPLTIMIGIYEELVFRGFLMTRLRRAMGGWTGAVILSTAVFTSLHAFDQTWSALIFVALLSFVFSLVTIWRRSIIPAVVAHALFDLIQLLLLRWSAGDAWK